MMSPTNERVRLSVFGAGADGVESVAAMAMESSDVDSLALLPAHDMVSVAMKADSMM